MESLDEPSAPSPSTADVRRVNARRVTGLLATSGPLTRAQVGHLSGLSRPTVTAVLRDLLACGVVRLQPAETSGSPGAKGRPARQVAFDETARSVAGIRLRRHVAELALFDLAGVERARETFPRPDSSDFVALAGAVADLARRTPFLGPLSAVTLLSAGRVERNGSVTVTLPSADWDRSPVTMTASAAFGVPVDVLTPAAAALLGQLTPRRARPGPDPVATPTQAVWLPDALLFFLDQGMAMAASSRGVLTIGVAAGTGEIGHIVVLPGGRSCECGRRGCLETVASGRAIRHLADEATSSPGDAVLTLRELEQAGSPEVARILQDAARHLGEIAASFVSAHRPAHVLLGGTEFAAGADQFLATFVAACDERRAHLTGMRPTYAFADADADLRGAACNALTLLPEPYSLGIAADVGPPDRIRRRP